jgi:hypothetical protein
VISQHILKIIPNGFGIRKFGLARRLWISEETRAAHIRGCGRNDCPNYLREVEY